MTNNTVTREALSQIWDYLDETLPNPTSVCDDKFWSILTLHMVEDDDGVGFESCLDGEPETHAEIEVLDFDGEHDFGFIERLLERFGVTGGEEAGWRYTTGDTRSYPLYGITLPLDQ